MDDTPGYTEEPFACPGCGEAHTIDGVCTAGKAVIVTVTDAPGEMRIRRRAPLQPKPAPAWDGVVFRDHCLGCGRELGKGHPDTCSFWNGNREMESRRR